MSRVLGNELPDDLFHALSSEDVSQQTGEVILVSTVDAEGWAHPALLSYREVGARDRTTLRVVTYAESRTTDNMRANGKLTLIFIDERMTYYVKGTAKEVPSRRTGTPSQFATMDVAVHEVLADSAGADEGGAAIATGITFHNRNP